MVIFIYVTNIQFKMHACLTIHMIKEEYGKLRPKKKL